MNLDKIQQFELVEITINANQAGRFYFESQPQLRNQSDQIITIKKISVYTTETYANSQVTNAVPGMAPTEMPKAVLTLYVNGEERIKSFPLAELNNISDGTSPFQQEIETLADLQNVDWSKSYVQFSAAAAGTPYVIPFGVSYVRFNRNPNNPEQWINTNKV